ncbi:hypothetical protein ACOMHN_020030 [Nucella lapillus]
MTCAVCRLVQAALLGMLACSLGVQASRGFRLRDCAPNSPRKLLTLTNPRVSPHPIVLPGDFSVTSSLVLYRNVTGHVMLDVNVARYFGPFKIPIPCMHGVGSCQYTDVCELLGHAFPAGARCPAQLRADGVPCRCPVQAGTYSLTDAVFHVLQLAELWAWIAQGDYQVTGQLKDPASGEVIACQQLDVAIRAPCTNIFCRLFG